VYNLICFIAAKKDFLFNLSFHVKHKNNCCDKKAERQSQKVSHETFLWRNGWKEGFFLSFPQKL